MNTEYFDTPWIEVTRREVTPPLQFPNDGDFGSWLKYAAADVGRKASGCSLQPSDFAVSEPTIPGAVKEFSALYQAEPDHTLRITFAIMGWYNSRLLAYLLFDNEPAVFIEPDTFLKNPAKIDPHIGPLDMWWTNLLDWIQRDYIERIHSWTESTLPWKDDPEELQCAFRRNYGISAGRSWWFNTESFQSAAEIADFLNEPRGVDVAFEVYPALSKKGGSQKLARPHLQQIAQYGWVKEDLCMNPPQVCQESLRTLDFRNYRGHGFQAIVHNRTLQTEMNLRAGLGNLEQIRASYVFKFDDLRPYFGKANSGQKGKYYIVHPRGSQFALLIPSRYAVLKISVDADYGEVTVKVSDVCYVAAHVKKLRRFEDAWLPYKSTDRVITPENAELQALLTIQRLDDLRGKEIPSQVKLWQYHSGKHWFSGLEHSERYSRPTANNNKQNH